MASTLKFATKKRIILLSPVLSRNRRYKRNFHFVNFFCSKVDKSLIMAVINFFVQVRCDYYSQPRLDCHTYFPSMRIKQSIFGLLVRVTKRPTYRQINIKPFTWNLIEINILLIQLWILFSVVTTQKLLSWIMTRRLLRLKISWKCFGQTMSMD